MSISVLNPDASLSGKTIGNLEDAQTVTGLKTFDRDPNPPFAVAAGSAAVANLDADKLDGFEAAAFPRLAVANTFTAANTFTGANSFTGENTFTDRVTVNGAGVTQSVYRVLTAGSTIGTVGASGAIEGNANTELGIFAETGKGVKIYVNGSGAAVATLGPSTNTFTLPWVGTFSTGAAAEITPAALTGDVNDYAIPNMNIARVVRISATGASRTITGIAVAGLPAGGWFLLVNHGAQDLVLANESASSLAQNRFACPGAVNFTLNQGDSVWIYYEHGSSRWRVIGA